MKQVTHRVIIVDDDPQIVRVLSRWFGDAGYEVTPFVEPAQVLDALEDEPDDPPSVLLSDLDMPGMTGIELLQRAHERVPELPVIIVTGQATVETAVQAMKRGAFDYLTKPLTSPDVVLGAAARAISHGSLVRENEHLRQRLDVAERFAGIIGDGHAMRRVLGLVDAVATSDSTVLITGESGTGKELVARAIHQRSPRRGRAMVTINCGALAPSVLESELFGHVQGAFTGATSSRRGLFEAASGGTILLDEIGELPPEMQVRLLRVIQEREVRPVGTNEARPVDIRVIAATLRDLDEDVRKGRFREDLYYRLNVIRVDVPPLRDRRDDIPALVDHFLRKHGDRMGKEAVRVSSDAMDALVDHAWPGNVRELENAIERALVLASQGVVELDHLPRWSKKQLEQPSSEGDIEEAGYRAAVERFERHALRTLVDRAGGNLTEAARLAKMDRSNFRRTLRRLGVKLDTR